MAEERSQEELDLIDSRYHRASGFRVTDIAFLGIRYNELRGVVTGDCEDWIGDVRAGTDGAEVRFHLGYAAFMSGLWRSPSGRCFVSMSLGPGLAGPTMFVNRDVGADGAMGRWTEFQFPHRGTLAGVWGLADDCVYAWGSASRGGPHHFYRFDSSSWLPLAAPDFMVTALHGCSEDHLVAVGIEGQISVFDGQRWVRVGSPTNEYLTAVHVESPGVTFAVGRRGNLYEGSPYGWGKVAEGPRMPTGEGVPLHAVATWRGEVWVGAGVAGLFKRTGTGIHLECVDPTATALCLDAREQLIAACLYKIVGTDDGSTFETVAELALRDYRAGRFLTEW